VPLSRGRCAAVTRLQQQCTQLSVCEMHAVHACQPATPMQVEEYAEELRQAGVEQVFQEVCDPDLKYPEYYLNKFHVRPPAPATASASVAPQSVKQHSCSDSVSAATLCKQLLLCTSLGLAEGYPVARA
jgi:hypothetical protein